MPTPVKVDNIIARPLHTRAGDRVSRNGIVSSEVNTPCYDAVGRRRGHERRVKGAHRDRG